MRLGSRSFLPTGRRKAVAGFGLAFVIGLGATLAIGAGGMYAYDQQYVGRILPGVHVGSVDLSGLDRDEARQQLLAAHAALGEGSLVLEAPGAEITIAYADLDRGLDVEPLLDAAMAVGRAPSPVDRAVAQARTAIEGVALEPAVRYDAAALNAAIVKAVTPLVVAPVDATLASSEEGFTSTPASPGQTLSVADIQAAVATQIENLDLGPELRVEVVARPLAPRIDDADAAAAIAAAERMAQDVEVTIGDEAWPIRANTIGAWISFRETPDGGVAPAIDTEAASTTIRSIAKKIDREPKNATFLVGKSGAIVGVTASNDGRAVDQEATTAGLISLLEARAAGTVSATLEPTLAAIAPELTTEEAEKAAPRMVRISTWTTYYPISEKNGFAVNITIPTSIIDGTVVAPGEWFDFWKAVGPVSREAGYKDGGAILNGRTEPTGALAGGICSCSTTLFNAAARAGLEMGRRENHYYYIDRYPLGLDATVWKSAGSTQSMSFRNDTPYPILVRGINTRKGNAGYVRFDLYSVPTGRTVSFSKPIVKDVKPATTITQETSELKKGQRKQIEWPVDGRNVWVTRTVRDSSGAVIHSDTWYSDYKRIDGIILVGTGGATPKPTTTPPPSATPAPTPAPTSGPTPAPEPTPEPSPAP